MSEPLKISLAQLNPLVGDIGGNTDKILNAWKNADEHSDLVVFSELVLCGYPPEDLILKPCFIEQCAKALKTLAQQSQNFKSVAIIGAPVSQNGHLYNAAILIEDGEIKNTILKHVLPDYGVFDEDRTFKAGELQAPVTIKGHKLGIMICEDMWTPKVSAHLKEQGAETLIIINGSPYTVPKLNMRLNIARKRINETNLPIVYVNQIGGQDELVFDGGSFKMNLKGEITQQLPFFEECIAAPEQDFDLNWSAEEYYDRIVPLHTYEALKLGLKDYIRKNGFPGVLIGLSGGIDSALAVVIAADALGAENVHAVMMSSKFTSRTSIEDAEKLADNIGITLETISIEDTVTAIEKTMPDLSNLAKENIQSRARGLILMALSNTTGKMVLTTGNKSEMATGYATLYGDMCGGFNALKDVYKTHVYELARWRNEQNPVIPGNIIDKAPTAELRENQTDQDSLPPYDILDGILYGLIEEEKSAEDLTKGGAYNRETILKVWKLLDQSEYKRKQSAPGTKITAKAFGRDRRYPMTNKFFKMVEKSG